MSQVRGAWKAVSTDIGPPGRTAVNKSLITAALSLSFLVSITLLATGCVANKKGLALSSAGKRAAGYNQKALKAYEKGSHKLALRYYDEALRISRSAEDADSIAMTLNAFTAVYRALGRRDEAHAAVDEVLGSLRPEYSPRRRSDAAALKILLYIDSGEYRTASEWADRVLSVCGSSGCGARWRLFTLKARALFLDGKYIPALDSGARGYWLSRKNSDRGEEANALRLMADARDALGEHEEAVRLYMKALSIDRDLGSNRKVFRDLMGIGRALLGQGKESDAINYYLRALLVSEADNDEKGSKEVSAVIKQLRELE